MKIRIYSRKLVHVYGEPLGLFLFTEQLFWWSADVWNSAEPLSVFCNSSKVKYHIATDIRERHTPGRA